MSVGRYGQPDHRVVNEAELFRAYRNGESGVRMERCACGTDILAGSHHAEDIMTAVSRHNESGPHKRWRAFFLPPNPTIATEPVDVSGNTSDASGSAGEDAA